MGDKTSPGIIGRHEIGKRNERGDQVIEFCTENNLFVANTMFELDFDHLYTWTSPDGNFKNQIDFIIGKQRWRSAIKAVKSNPDADCGSDHELLEAKITVKLRNSKKDTHKAKLDLYNIPHQYKAAAGKRIANITTVGKDPEQIWDNIKESIIQEVSVIPKRMKCKSQWLKMETIGIAEERNESKKARDLEKVRRLNGEFPREARKDKENYINNKCHEIEQNNKAHPKDMFRELKKSAWSLNPKMGT